MTEKNSMKWKNENTENPLIRNDALYHTALDEFSKKPYHQASLNDILKAVKMNKGSFYYRFYDKMDLYLSLFHRVGMCKLAFFQEHLGEQSIPEGFYEQIGMMARLGLFFARQESRYYLFWRNYLSEEPRIHNIVRENFAYLADDRMDEMIAAAKSRGELDKSYSSQFLQSVIKLLIYHLDTLIDAALSDEEILKTVDELIRFMKNGLSPVGKQTDHGIR